MKGRSLQSSLGSISVENKPKAANPSLAASPSFKPKISEHVRPLLQRQATCACGGGCGRCQEGAQSVQPIAVSQAPRHIARSPDEVSTPNEQDYSLSELEAEVLRLRGQLQQMPPANTEARELLSHRLNALEAGLTERQRTGIASAAHARVLRVGPGPLGDRITIAFTSGFTAGALMEYRPAEGQRFIAEIQEHTVRFSAGIYLGLSEGAVLDLWNNVHGLAELALWLSPAYWAYRAIDCASNPVACQAQRAETAQTMEALRTGLPQLLAAIARDPSFLVTQGHELGLILGQDAANWFNNSFMRRTPYEKGETIGIAIGTVVMEVALLFLGPEEWIARGGAALAQAGRASAGLRRALVRLIEGIPALRRLMELRGLLRGTRVAGETAEAVRAGERVVEGASDATRVAGHVEPVAAETGRAAGHVEPVAADTGRVAESAAAERGRVAEPIASVPGPEPRPPVTEATAPPVTEAPHAPESAPVAAAPPLAGSEQVWVNTRSGVFHREGSAVFRTGTREGRFMSRAEAEAAGHTPVGQPRQRPRGAEGDVINQRALDEASPENRLALEEALGSNFRPPHRATVRVQNAEGIRSWELNSGNATPEELALGWPQSALATHTEARAVRHPLQRGETMRITGDYDPCSACQRAMKEAANRTGATIIYWWPGGQVRFPPRP